MTKMQTVTAVPKTVRMMIKAASRQRTPKKTLRRRLRLKKK